MSKTKQPPLADWHVVLGDGSYSESRTVRASSAIVVDGWLYLRDAYGGLLFGAPHTRVRHFRRLEPGEQVPALILPPAERGGYTSSDRTADELSAPPASVTAPSADPGPVEVTPGPRPRTTRRGK